MAVRLFVGNLSYTTTEADLRTYFGGIAPPSQVVLPVDRETGRPRGFAFVEYQDRAHAERAIQQFNGQVFNGRADMGWANTPVAMTIAIAKALLVLLVFMELRHSTRMTLLTAAAGFFLRMSRS